MCCYFVQVFYKLIRRYKYLEKAFEDEVRKVSTFTACQWNQCSWACSPLKIMLMIRVWKFWTTILQCVCCAEGVLIRSPASQLDCVDNLIFAFSSCCFCSECDCPASQLDCVDNLIFAFSSCCFCSECDCPASQLDCVDNLIFAFSSCCFCSECDCPASQLDCVDNLIFAFSSCCFCSGCDCLKVLRGVCLNHDSRRLLPSLDICVCSFAGCRMVCHVLYYFAFISRAWNSLKHLTGPN